MKVDYLILGQGISGSFLSYFLSKEGASVHVIDVHNDHAASRVASGIINPVTGRRVVKTWMIDEIMPFAVQAYHEIAGEISFANSIRKTSILDFVATTQMLDAYAKRMAQDESFINFPVDLPEIDLYFNYPFKIAEIKEAYNIRLQKLLAAYRSYLVNLGHLSEEVFDWNLCSLLPEKVVYKNIEARKIICCDGISSAANHYFKNLPFALNKGEALLVEINDLPTRFIYKMGYNLVAHEKNTFWIGANYIWNYEDEKPTDSFRNGVETQLQNWLKIPYKVIDHISGIRPANIERRPFVGLHPAYPSLGILNGMGSKGCSLAPYFAYQLAHHLLYNKPLEPLANIHRFRKILAK